MFVVGVLFVGASFAFSLALRASAARRYLTAHLAASFGRSVDVSWFDFSLLDGGRIEGHSVTVSEDPRFGNEYFLRSDTLAAGLRWSALLAGRFEFGSVYLSRPSLNLVRNADGEWNIERWLPPASSQGARPGFVGPVPPSPEVRPTRPVRIDIDDGRIDFKRGEDKISFALVDVSGRIEQNGPGRWQLDLEARPMRAGVELQDIGTMRVRGSMAGTTARLQPAELALTWRAASVADALRLMTQNDYGMRGELDVDVNARIAAPSAESPAASRAVERSTASRDGSKWSVAGVAHLTGIHAWELPGHGSDPSANLSVDMDWRIGEPRVQIHELRVEMPASHFEGNGEVDWARGIRPKLQIASSTIGFGDVLSWYRALRPGVAEDLQATGSFGVDLKMDGWPMELQGGSISSAGGTLVAKTLPTALRIGGVHAGLAHGKLDLSPAEISFLPISSPAGASVQAASIPKNGFVLRGSLSAQAGTAFHPPFNWNVTIEGATARVQDWMALTAALARPVNSGWTAAGGLAVKMRGERRVDLSAAPWNGAIDFSGLTLNPSYINGPIVFPKAHIEFAPTQRTVTVTSAQALGTSWRGSLTRKYSDAQWSFDLTADSLDAIELDRWLGPRARPGFLARIVGLEPAPASAGPLGDAPITRLAARGRLRAGAISVPPMRIEKFDGQMEVAGRAIHIRSAQGDFFGGRVSGFFDAELVRAPSYGFQGRFDRVDLALLGRGVPSLSGRIAGTASAELTLSAHGIGRQQLVDSMVGEGTLNGRNVSLRGIDLSNAAAGRANGGVPLPELFSSLQGAYRIGNRSIDFSDIALESSGRRLEADGRVDFSHALNIRIHPSSVEPVSTRAADSPPSFLLGGTIEAPNLFLAAAVPKPSAHARQ